MASRFWVGESGTWDASDTTHWSASTGGAGGASVPGSGDTVTFDALSAPLGGTCTVNTTVNVTSITMGAFTGVLDFAANDNNVTVVTFSASGTGARTLNMGNGTWTITGNSGSVWDFSTITGLVAFSADSSTLLFQGSAVNTSQKVFATGGRTYNIVQINDQTGAGNQAPFSFTGAATIATFTPTAVRHLQFTGGSTTIITNAFSLSGNSTTQILVNSQSTNAVATLSVGAAVTMNWVALENIVKAGAGSITATSSFDLGGNSGITINKPVGGGIING